ncbi:hypothetical protein Bhyg_15769, partial [Pseudolycoriella hygida]
TENLQTVDYVINLFGNDSETIPSMGKPFINAKNAQASSNNPVPHIQTIDIENALCAFEDDTDAILHYLERIYPNASRHALFEAVQEGLILREMTPGRTVINEVDVQQALEAIIEQVNKLNSGGKIGHIEERIMRTPPPKGERYRPNDFSPSSLGACSTLTMDFLREKRSLHLPGYVSPQRTPRSQRMEPNESKRKESNESEERKP